jgi:hypothetical protein
MSNEQSLHNTAANRPDIIEHQKLTVKYYKSVQRSISESDSCKYLTDDTKKAEGYLLVLYSTIIRLQRIM